VAAWPSRSWADWTSEAFAHLDRERLIAVLPVAATEPHGPHMPMSTDHATIDGRPPVSTVVEVSGLPPSREVRIEVEATAFIPLAR
jgi:hypothetical protein